jgi:hypothetical protein
MTVLNRAFRITQFFFLLSASATVAADALDLSVLETDELQLFYVDPLQTYLVPHTARSFHNSMEFQKYIFDWKPWDEQTVVLLKDFSDFGNAAASVAPVNRLLIDIAPPSHTFETLPGSERIYSTMNHELVHLATGDAWNEREAWWRRFFGGKPAVTDDHPESILFFYFSTPRMAVPRWYSEGSAVFMETWMSGGVGRAQGAYDEMVFRSMVRDDAHFYSALGLVSQGTRIDFQVGVNAYLYGTRFMSYLALNRSPEQLIEWLSRGDDSERYYASQFERVFGESLEKVWDDWIDWEREFQTANLQSVRQHPITEARHLTRGAAGSISRSFFDSKRNELIGAYRVPGIVAHVGILSLDSGEIQRVTDIKGPKLYLVSSTAYDADSRTFFYTADNGMYRDLMRVDLDSGKEQMLLKDARIGDIVYDRSDGALWGLRQLDGYVSLVRIPPPYDGWNQVYTWPYGSVPFEMDVSPDGELISMSVGELDGKQYLRVFRTPDLLDGIIQPIAEFDFGVAIPEGFVFSPDGRYLYGSSYYTGISNIFRYEIATEELEAVSNAETGFFRPIPNEDGSLIVFEFTGKGFVPAVIDPKPLEHVSSVKFLGSEIAKQHPVVREWGVGSPADVPLDDMITREGTHKPIREIQQLSRYPIIEGYRDTVALGYSWEGADPMLFNSLSINASYSLDSSLDSDERLHADIQYETLRWRFRYWHNNADFYDLFGPTERSRKGDAFIVGYDKPLIFELPRRMDIDISAAYYTGLDTLPNNQNVPTSFEKLASARVGLDYTHTRKSLGAVDHEKGFRWDIMAYGDYADSDFVPKIRGGVDFGFALPWKHSSIWFYNAAGIADGDRDNSLANWFFGGFGNNYVDDREIKRYREFYSFPGFEIDEVFGQDFAKSVVEWNLPPITFREIGTPSFYLTWMRAALFAGALVTDLGDDDYRETYTSLGFQVDLQFTVVHRLPMTLSLGYAQGYLDGDKYDEEIMLSLKIL